MPHGGDKLTISIGDTVKRILPDPNRCTNFHDDFKVYSQYRKIQEGRPTSNTYTDYPIWQYWTLIYGRNPGTGESGNPGKETGLRVDYDSELKKMVLHGTVTRSDGHIYPMLSSLEYGGMGWFSDFPASATEVRSAASIDCWADTQTWDIQINDPPTTPSVPGNALVVYGENVATLYWSHDQSYESALRFEIYRKAPGQSAYSSSPVHTTGENTTIWTDTDRSRDNKAVYCVKAVHGTFKSACSDDATDYADLPPIGADESTRITSGPGLDGLVVKVSTGVTGSTFGSDVLVPVFDVAEKSYAISVANDITKVSIIPTKRSTDDTIQYRSSLTCNTCQWTDDDSNAAGLQDDLAVGESTFVVEVTRTTLVGKHST